MESTESFRPSRSPWRRRLHEIIFEADTPAGRWFDIGLLIAILMSVLAVMLESVAEIDQQYHTALVTAEWTFTVLFSVEYVLRLLCVARPRRYALSFYGIIDLMAVLPTYLAFFMPGAQHLMVIRGLRLLRVFRVMKLGRYLTEAAALRQALWASRAKITVFLSTVAVLVIIMGALMHLVEGPENGFTSIPRSVYWAIVTITTVGYGDLSPVTVMGQILACAMMITGYSLIIVPTGILSAELTHAVKHPVSTQVCPHCSLEGHAADAAFCKYCGGKL